MVVQAVLATKLVHLAIHLLYLAQELQQLPQQEEEVVLMLIMWLVKMEVLEAEEDRVLLLEME
jgi:hypothetical protein